MYIYLLGPGKSMGILLGFWEIPPSWGPGNLNKTPHPSAITAHKPAEGLACAETRILTGHLGLWVYRGRPGALGRDGTWALRVIPYEAVPWNSSSGVIRRLPSSR